MNAKEYYQMKLIVSFQVYIVAMVSNSSAPGSYVKQLDSKPFNNRAELARWRNEMNRHHSNPLNSHESEDEEYGEFESKGESLLQLVEPELESLGENWIAALKDHALLSLPPGTILRYQLIKLYQHGELMKTLRK